MHKNISACFINTLNIVNMDYIGLNETEHSTLLWVYKDNYILSPLINKICFSSAI